MDDKQLKRNAFFTAFLISLIMALSSGFYLFKLSKVVAILISAFLFLITFVQIYALFVSKGRLQMYVKKYQLTPEGLAELTGRSKYDFPGNGRGEIRMVEAGYRDYMQLVRRLMLEYGEL